MADYKPYKRHSGSGDDLTGRNYETKLGPQREAAFQQWFDKQHSSGRISEGDYRFYKANGFGYDYDFRAAFAAGEKQGKNGHWSDIGKKPNHQTFSTYSKYKDVPGGNPGTWDGDNYVPGKQSSRTTPFTEMYPAWNKPSFSIDSLFLTPAKPTPGGPNKSTMGRVYENILRDFSEVRQRDLMRKIDALKDVPQGPPTQVWGTNG